MRKETVIAIGIVAVALVLILAGLFWPSATTETPVVSEPVSVEIDGHKMTDTAELPGRPVPDSYPDGDDGNRDVTRIVIVDPDGEEITDLLSEKVIINDEVVDQAAKPE